MTPSSGNGTTVAVADTRADMLRAVETAIRGRAVAELGVFAGAFSREILALAPRTLHLIDRWQGDIVCGDKDGRNVVTRNGDLLYRGVSLAYRGRSDVRVHRGDTVATIAALRASESLVLDFAYVDASHEHEAVAADLDAVASVISPCGVIAGHDYCAAFPGVVRAVDEFCEARGWRVAMLTRDGCPSYVLVPR